MRTDLGRLLDGFELNPPASAVEIDSFLQAVGRVPDMDYLEFMKEHNGGEGIIGDLGYLIIWSLSEALQNTQDYRIDDVRAGLLLFATDGGDKAFAFDRAQLNWPIVSVSLTSASPEDI